MERNRLYIQEKSDLFENFSFNNYTVSNAILHVISYYLFSTCFCLLFDIWLFSYVPVLLSL